MMRKMMGVLLLCLLPVAAGSAWAQELTVASAINRAGYQRMLSQRIVKAYAQLGLEVAPDASRLQLNRAIDEFETNLGLLRAFMPNDALRSSLGRLDAAWKSLKGAVTEVPSRDKAAGIVRLGDDVLSAAEKLTRELEQYSGLPLGRLVNVSGRQRMLSQRLAKAYMLRAWGMEDTDTLRELRASGDEFVKALAELQAAPQNSYEINRELEAITLQWAWFQSALEQEGEYQSYLLVVADASESMLLSLDNLTTRYEELAARR